ncbi:MAG: type transport system ATP-binding protein [Chloroflexota bacterium]|jgi:ABC-2 type transport system ATP-binding protein|nr:type transport system ATP-binding protein [Chloroflexota bacterium]
MSAIEAHGGSDVALSVRDLRKSYGSRRALDGLDLTVPAGVVYGFLGPNGAGKTTTMRLLTGLLHADAGTIEILGKPYTRRERHILFDVGALVENPSFYPYLSARANLRELAASGPPANARRIEEVLELVGLHDRATEPVSRFSLGMKQRLGIAAALLNDPQLLLLDEPSNGLDPAGIAAMRDLLRHLASIGKTVFVSSHLLGEVRQMADMVGIIAAGKMVREGPMSELLGSEGVVRVRVRPEDVARALELLTPFGPSESSEPEAGWVAVTIAPDSSEQVSKALADGGIYPSELLLGSDLEELFLKLTQESVHMDPDGSFARIDTAGAGPQTPAAGPQVQP